MIQAEGWQRAESAQAPCGLVMNRRRRALPVPMNLGWAANAGNGSTKLCRRTPNGAGLAQVCASSDGVAEQWALK